MAVHVIVYEGVNLVYMYLNGSQLSGAILQRSLIDIISTTMMTAIIMVPVRMLLGFRKKEESQAPDMRFDHRPARD